MNEAAGNSRDEKTIIDLQLDGMLQFLVSFLKHAIKSFCLCHRPWKSIENEAGQS